MIPADLLPYEDEIRSVEGPRARKRARLSIPPLHPLDQLHVLIVRLGRELTTIKSNGLIPI